ncbi:hypothetical protein HMN09_00124100 [Mycena chlorophos]|uniref:Uncharacterized protein n=1 Tax=Mycena chlorophos TaxID=658473 RepID=A0A8H6WN38_MYCCL|nr:hypothetical protein HMN09_00124100 [Mycena chlorophos]
MIFRSLAVAGLSATAVQAHLAPYVKGMYALNGAVAGVVNYNNEDVVYPLWQLSQSDWWFHGYNNVPDFPPADGDFLELPAGGSFTVEIASNQGKTSLSFNGAYTSEWPDGNTYPEDYNIPTCITSPNMHAQNQSMAAGTAFAISYTSTLSEVTPGNLVVFSVAYNTPWKRVQSYDVPAAMPACPEGGCICGWGWVPNGCGEPNMYHLPYRCKVTGATGTKAVGTPKPPVWCQDDPSSCVSGPKQMVYWNQLEGNNIEVSGYDNAGDPKSPGYNGNCGFADGAQNDIFTGGSVSGAKTSSTTSVKEEPKVATTTTSKTSSSTVAPSATSSAAAAAAPTSLLDMVMTGAMAMTVGMGMTAAMKTAATMLRTWNRVMGTTAATRNSSRVMAMIADMVMTAATTMRTLNPAMVMTADTVMIVDTAMTGVMGTTAATATTVAPTASPSNWF